jgi:hypothetical protein
MLKLNAKIKTMKLSLFIISVIFFSYHLTAQKNNKNKFSKKITSEKVKASDLKKKDFKQVQVISKNKLKTDKNSNNKSKPKIKSKNKTIVKPKH